MSSVFNITDGWIQTLICRSLSQFLFWGRGWLNLLIFNPQGVKSDWQIFGYRQLWGMGQETRFNRDNVEWDGERGGNGVGEWVRGMGSGNRVGWGGGEDGGMGDRERGWGFFF